MINQIQLTNFRQHRNLEVNLTSGLNVIRGANEAGKSTIMEAVEYGFYGARALRETLDETVTWGEPATTLRVVIKFTYDGIDGVVSRSKSGAEVMYGSTLASGQNEVTKFFEHLFRTSAAMASNLQIASQTKVRGAVEGGGSNAVALIEALADFSLLETIIERIQQTRPFGNTNTISDRINRLQEAMAGDPVKPDRSGVEAATKALEIVRGNVANLEGGYKSLSVEAAAARAMIQAADRLSQAQERARKRRAEVVGALAQPLPPEPPSAAHVAEWRANLEAKAQMRKLRQAYNVAAPKAANSWAGDRDSFVAAFSKNNSDESEAGQRLIKLREQHAVKLVLKVNEDVCSFCKKDLTQVPEVVALNASLDAECAALAAEIAEVEKLRKSLAEDAGAYREIEIADRKFDALFPRNLWQHNMETMPRTVTWIGPAITEEGDNAPDWEGMIANAERQQRQYDMAKGNRAALEAELQRIDSQDLAESVPDTTKAKETVAAFEKVEQAYNLATSAEREAVTQVSIKTVQYESEMRLYDDRVKQKAAAVNELTKAKEELSSTVFHNELVRKIRSARPAVANKLWALVLAAVSHYTSMGRGQPSNVTRDKGGFRINGKAVAAYSGSAQDVLGMAVRLGLIKTFLPNTPFMIMDEIAAACDDNRELEMLGMVIAADIPQVLLVTHSNMAESFASNLIQL